MRFAAVIACLLSVSLPGGLASAQEPVVPQAAPAQPDQAQQEDPRPQDAQRACLAGDTAKGIALLADLYVETRDPTWLFNQGRCHQQNGQNEQALLRFREFLRVGREQSPELAKRAEALISEIEAEAARGRAGGAPPLPAPPPPRTSAAPSPDLAASGGRQPRFTGKQVTGMVVAGFGVAALGAGAFFSFKVQSAESDVNQLVKGQTLVEAGQLKERDRAGARYELMQWISYGVGLAALTAGATTFYLGQRTNERGASISVVPSFLPTGGGASLRAAF